MTHLTSFLIVGLGGALGAMARLLMTRLMPEFLLGSFPFQIFAVNILGCFAMGVLAELMALHWSPSMHLRSFLTTGFLGGFTTFSAFALEVGLLTDKGMHLISFIYIILSVVLSLMAFFAGLKLVQLF